MCYCAFNLLTIIQDCFSSNGAKQSRRWLNFQIPKTTAAFESWRQINNKPMYIKGKHSTFAQRLFHCLFDDVAKFSLDTAQVLHRKITYCFIF